ncbi:MAG TPA: ABC transporter ATP-binding protein [Mycobacteriales bacterium]|nr:ABC transporter ATP-binding protein [Mycobacteriales bacterium]
MTAAIATDGLTKHFRGAPSAAVDHLALDVPVGAVYGFLGPNGSGKTTTIRMLLGLISPTEGSVELFGQPIPGASARLLPRVGALVEGPAFHPYLSGRANLRRLDAVDATVDPGTSPARVDSALDRVGLLAAAEKRYRVYSLGMRQRLGLAAALLRPRDLLVLDEPTNGLDPQGTREVRTLIRDVAADGLTVFVSSHLLAEVEQTCSHVGIMGAGRLAYQGSLRDLHAQGVRRAQVTTPDPGLARDILAGLPTVDVATTADGPEGALLSVALGSAAAEDVVAALVRAGVRIRGFTVERATLEDVFVALTGEGFDVAR